MCDAHFSIRALFIGGAGDVGTCCKSTLKQGDESCYDDRVHGDRRDGMQTARAAQSYERRKMAPPLNFSTPLRGRFVFLNRAFQ